MPSILGLDLSDAYSKRPRASTCAFLTKAGLQLFDLPWDRDPHELGRDLAGVIEARVGECPDLVVIDGPAALAAPGQSIRSAERRLATPGRTGHELPSLDSRRPFAGYIRSSIELFSGLRASGRWVEATAVDGRSATLLEAYPGAAWKAFAAGVLKPKNRAEGRRQRLEILTRLGLTVPDTAPHDELDAALCALIGRRYAEGGPLDLVGQALFDDGVWREGFIVMPRASNETEAASASLATLRDSLRTFIAERDWQQFHSPKNLAMALAGEVGELIEHFQWLTEEASRELSAEEKAMVEEELADVLIYLVRLADELDVDLGAAARRKLAANAKKYPPDQVRGDARKYDRY